MKITYDKNVAEEAGKNYFSGTKKIHRLFSILWAEMKCNFYLLGAGMTRGECLLVGYGSNGKRSIIGTVTGSMFDGTLQLRRVFWCCNEGKNE